MVIYNYGMLPEWRGREGAFHHEPFYTEIIRKGDCYDTIVKLHHNRPPIAPNPN